MSELEIPLSDESHDAGLRAIIFYKATKGTIQLILAGILFVMISAGLTRHLHELAVRLGNQAVSAWSIELAALLLTIASGRHLALTCIALACDGTLTLIEGWALHRRHWWGPWLVVAASGSLVPYELLEIIHQPRVGRLFLLAANLVIVLYLARRAWKEHLERRRRMENRIV